MGAPGLAFETWDPSNQFLLETRTLCLSLGGQLRDLQLGGCILEMFSTERSVLRSSLHNHPPTNNKTAS
jgi:hypothetical protein